jgi:hypothetical protein
VLRHVRALGTLLLTAALAVAADARGSGDHAHAKAAPAAGAKVAKDGWPETPAGERGRQWVQAFSSGEDAMRECLKNSVADTSLVRRGVARRMESYRTMRERFGSLVLASVEESERHKLTVSLLAEDASVHRFVFTVQGGAPYKLVSVGMLEFSHSGHAGHHGSP